MALPPVILIMRALSTTFIFLLVIIIGGVSSAAAAHTELRGSIRCLDCPPQFNLSDVVVAIRYGDSGGEMKSPRQVTALTDKEGNFQVDVTATSDHTPATASILGGHQQLCAFQNAMVVPVVAVRQGPEITSYRLSSPLTFFTSCCAPPSSSSCGVGNTAAQVDAARAPPRRALPSPAARPAAPSGGTIQTPPAPYGLGIPLIYFFPFFPIIGIP